VSGHPTQEIAPLDHVIAVIGSGLAAGLARLGTVIPEHALYVMLHFFRSSAPRWNADDRYVAARPL